MTYAGIRKLVEGGTIAAAALAFLIVPYIAAVKLPDAGKIAIGAIALVALYVLRERGAAAIDRAVRRSRFGKAETRIVMDFAERVGVSFTMSDLIEAISEKLEKLADMSVILVKSDTWETIYQSNSAAAIDPRTLESLKRNFSEWPDGSCFVDDDFSAQTTGAGARGHFFKSGGICFLMLSRLCQVIEPDAFLALLGEFRVFFDRITTISGLFEVATRSREWALVAETQRSFLPRVLPKPERLDIAVAYRPLLSVSGDYYDVIAIDGSRTLLVVGDVSGKGLSAALVMSIILNTIRVAKDKGDLEALIRNVDTAIREMDFEDKSTMIFLGLVDTERQILRYVNAALANPIVISQTALGPNSRSIDSTMGSIGSAPLESVAVEEIPIKTDDVILLASDGVTEAEDEAGGHLGETALYRRTLAQASRHGGAEDFVARLSGLVYSFVGDRPLRDDITILVAKVGRLWD